MVLPECVPEYDIEVARERHVMHAVPCMSCRSSCLSSFLRVLHEDPPVFWVPARCPQLEVLHASTVIAMCAVIAAHIADIPAIHVIISVCGLFIKLSM